jgi:hypothetical protein
MKQSSNAALNGSLFNSYGLFGQPEGKEIGERNELLLLFRKKIS